MLHEDLTIACAISIHALREEGDPDGPHTRGTDAHISIHALREEGDHPLGNVFCGQNTFLSTPSARRATGQAAGRDRNQADFYPRPPRGGRPSASMVFAILCYFYPRPPRGGRLSDVLALRTSDLISIHSLREEGDPLIKLGYTDSIDFYPRPPRGGRRLIDDNFMTKVFISIHALREEGDQGRGGALRSNEIFLSTPSVRRTTWRWKPNNTKEGYFYPRPPRGGRRVPAAA